MAEFKITRFRYTWRGNWSADYSSTYDKDDVVFYRGSSWACIRQHTPTVFDDDQTFTSPGDTFPSPAWVKTTEGRQFLGSWNAANRYDPGVLVLSGGNVYLCVDSHISSSNFNNDLNKWEIFAVGSNFRNEWTVDTRYRVGDVIRYNGYTYQCVLEHTSGQLEDGVGVGNNDQNDDSTAETWTVLTENYTFVGEYQTNTRYRKNDLVKYGGSLLKCIIEHTTDSIFGNVDNANFETYLPGLNFYPEYQNSIYYAIGDVVRYGGSLYVASSNLINSVPGASISFPNGNPNWTYIHKGISFRGEYDPGSLIAYKEGDVVRRGGSLWLSIANQQSDDSSLAPFDTSNWELVVTAINFRGSWKTDQDYNFYDAVYYRGTVYYASTPHNSSFDNFPGDNGEGFSYWTVLIVGDPNASLTNLGDLVTYNLTRFLLEDDSTTKVLGDESTIGHTPIPIGSQDQLLVVENNQGDIGYKTWGNLERVFFVSTSIGVDDISDPNRGKNYFKPWKTLRYALERADDGFEGFTTIKVATGEYNETLPLIVPVRTAVVGEELRSTTIRAAEAIPALANDAQYTLSTLLRLGTVLPLVVQGQSVAKTVGNDEIQITAEPGGSSEAASVNSSWAAIIQTIEYLVNDEGSLPTITGSNTENNTPIVLSAIAILEANRSFLKAEAIAYMEVNNPEYAFDQEKCRRDIDRFIDAVQYDLRYPGNYKSQLAGRYYANAVTGSQLEDMFYVRDTTGIRNLTLKGLEGTLPALQAGQTYRIPTGGAFVSLDPGWGPDDERVWITNRSCYIQNVTTFGTGAVGQKIDGLLHNGGNRSIVSNDFTQVISDGIGAWVQNGGRAELVSVFTYYAHIGMFAKDGGIIRATNGNSSYGEFGTVADGIDPDEVVRFAKVNTRNQQAIVDSAFAGEVNDFILALEFINSGQNYTQAAYTITSSGTGASAIQEEFRDNALFNCLIRSAGSSYGQYGNQAQTGTTTTITLATAETALEADILGMRIIIISGEGTGQYGYVQAYNPSTKVCTVYRESDNLPGWDNILPGTPPRALLTAGTRYRIEPRPIFEHPGFTATDVSLNLSGTFASAAYGETSRTFNNVSASAGTGSTIDITPVVATFNVIKSGRSYSVTLNSGGAGYQTGDRLLIDGSVVGGISLEHDIEIIVTATTDDSTNSILTFSVSGNSIADSGKFVLLPTTGNVGRYSSDGLSWANMDLPSSGNWKCLAAGNNRFVALRNSSGAGAYSFDGINWTGVSLPSNRLWNGVAFGKPSTLQTGVFVAVAGNLNSAIYSTDGINWSSSTLPTFGDSTLNEYVDIAFGVNKFIALSNSGNIVAEGQWNGSSITWNGHIMDVVADSSAKDWVSIAYGNRRFVAISSTGDIAYSFDGETWYPGTMPSQDGSTAHNWKQIRYGQGVFFAVGDTGGRDVGADPTLGETTFAATSYDGVTWTPVTLASSDQWGLVAFGNPDVTLGDSTVSNSKPIWLVISSNPSATINYVLTGARALGRLTVDGSGIARVKIWEPGSNYTYPPSLTIIDPSNTIDAVIETRIADGVLAQPTFISSGSAYKTSTTFVTVSGDGFADVIPQGRFLTLDNLSLMPGPGAQFYIGGKTDYFTAVIVGIDEEVQVDGSITATFQVSPRPDLDDFLEHDMEVVIRERYSQVRITGHDFLDVGSGNFEDTNYPVLYQDYLYEKDPLKEVQNLNGGRVFYTSTDQDGNFRAGDQFAVEQATGIITISADFFDLEGLTELRLGGIRVGTTAVVREFSKDPLFLQNSNSVIPTQRAVRAYLQSRLNIGGEDLLTPSFIAGTVKVGPNLIDNTAGLAVEIPVIADFSGPGVGISGSWIAQALFYKSWKFA